MTLRGGPAAKLGNRFEKWWTLSELVRMLRGETDSLRIEEPGLDGVEFVVKCGSRREFHQAKRSHPSSAWSTAKLQSAGVLKKIGELLDGNEDRFVFVSGSHPGDLAGLCEAAASAESLDEFKQDFLAAQKRYRDYNRVLQEWNCDEHSAWSILRRVDVHTINDRELETKIDWGLSALFLGDVGPARDRLAAIVDDGVHRRVTREDLVQQLHKAGYLLRKVSGTPQARQAVHEATDRFLAGARSSLIQKLLIPREAAAKVVARLTGERPSDCVLVGRAGTGKTASVIEVVEKLQQQGAHVLAFRLDRHVSATSTVDLGRGLDLEESPALLLAHLANADDKPAVLIVDQLDAVSATSGRSSNAFDIVERLLMECRPASVHVAVVCRSFDWQHDSRLRGLIREEDQKIELGEFSDDDVRKVLAQAHVEREPSARQLALLRLPQNLSLFLATDGSASDALSFGTAKDLFDLYWDAKRRQVADRTDETDQWADVMATVCHEMTETQQLSVRKEKLDQFSLDYIHRCVSENVLVADGDTYGFGHESFFDYCFARRFAASDESLVEVLLKSSEQHLFRRAQVRQVLVYLRDADFKRYVGELHALVSDDNVRTHIKDLIFTLLASVDDPRDDEWNLWKDWVGPAVNALELGTINDDRLSERAWAQLLSARSWFKQLYSRGEIADWLASRSSPLADRAIDYLRWRQLDWPDRVAALLEPFVDQGGEWPNRLRTVVGIGHTHLSRRIFDLFLKLVDNGTFDATVNFWSICLSLVEHEPEWVPEVLAHQLRRHVALYQAALAEGRLADADWPTLGPDGSADDAFKGAIAHSPRRFVDYVLPAVLDASDAALKTSHLLPVRDKMWPLLVKDSASSLAYPCLHALADALAALADRGEDMDVQISELTSRQTHVANHLLLAIYRGGAARFADEAILAFSDHPWRFDCGYMDSPYWCATETVRVTVPYCEPASRAKLENAVLTYVNPHELTKEGLRQRGWAAFNLLDAIPDELRSANAKRRFAELERKFRRPLAAPKGIVTEWVGSPIPMEAAARMSEEQWLNAIVVKYQSENLAPKGGASQLARVFGRLAQDEPERFATIGLQLPSNTNPVYFSELLRALEGTSLADEAKVCLCQRVFEYARNECGKDIAMLLRATTQMLPGDAVGMLTALATERHDSEEEAWRQDAGGGQPYYGGDIHLNGINTTRGQAAEVIGKLIEGDASYIEKFQSALEELVHEHRPSVASCVARTLRAVAYHNHALGLELFLRMDFSEERLLGTDHVREFMRENLGHSFPSLRSMTLRLLRSRHPDIRRAGAQLVCLAALTHDDARELMVEAQQGDRLQRLGVADVASANVADPICRQWCEGALKDLFGDSDVEVRKVAALCFRELPEDRLADYSELIQAFCGSPSYKEEPFFLLSALKSARGQLPGIVCLACERFLDHLASETRAVGGRGTNSRMAVELAFRVYQQHQNDEWTSRALDLIDRICLEEPSEAAEDFENFER